MHFLNEVLQCVELLFPELLVISDPLCGGAKRLRVEPAAAHAAVFVSLHQSGIFEHPQMLLHGGQGHAVGAGQFAERELAAAQLRQDGAASGVGQGAEGGVEGRG